MNFLTIFDSLETGIYSLVAEHKFSLENYLIKINNFSICYKIAPPNGVMMWWIYELSMQLYLLTCYFIYQLVINIFET